MLFCVEASRLRVCSNHIAHENFRHSAQMYCCCNTVHHAETKNKKPWNYIKIRNHETKSKKPTWLLRRRSPATRGCHLPWPRMKLHLHGHHHTWSSKGAASTWATYKKRVPCRAQRVWGFNHWLVWVSMGPLQGSIIGVLMLHTHAEGTATLHSRICFWSCTVLCVTT